MACFCVGSATLLRFYVLHVAVLPAALIGLVTIHLWRWRKDSMLSSETAAGADSAAKLQPGVPITAIGDPVVLNGRRVLGVVPGKPAAGDRKVLSDDDPVMVWPHLLVRHGVAALAVLFVVLLFWVAGAIRKLLARRVLPSLKLDQGISYALANISWSLL